MEHELEVTFEVETWLYELLKAKAEERGISISQYVSLLVLGPQKENECKNQKNL